MDIAHGSGKIVQQNDGGEGGRTLLNCVTGESETAIHVQAVPVTPQLGISDSNYLDQVVTVGPLGDECTGSLRQFEESDDSP